MAETTATALPRVVSRTEWDVARQALLAKEKAATRALDALAAERRRLPMVKLEKEYTLEGPAGPVSLGELFAGRRQLIVYHFMFGPDWEVGCVGCSMLADSIGHLAHLNARDTSFVFVSRAPLAQLEAFERRMGWSVPWYSAYGSDFNFDLGASSEHGEGSVLSVFLRERDDIYFAYQTTARGIDRLNLVFNLLDLTPLGRQEDWEDSPPGWRQSQPYVWWRLHDEYAS
jgi:predicted dithiol-disulfide oxidoreductase (DUF899 family)